MKISELVSLAKEYYVNGNIHQVMVNRGYHLLGNGKDRHTWLSPNKKYVLKFPRDEGGICANQHEAKYYSKHKNRPDINGVVFAPCRLIANSILIMRAMVATYGTTSACNLARIAELTDDPWIDYNDPPEWMELIDCDQVGLLPDGRMAAYDYADYNNDPIENSNGTSKDSDGTSNQSENSSGNSGD